MGLLNLQDIYESFPNLMPREQQQARVVLSQPSVPLHSLVAFRVFLRLPGYADVLLRRRKQAQCLLRLLLGVTDDGDGGKETVLC